MFRFENISAFHWLWSLPVLLGVSILFSKFALNKVRATIGSRLYPFLSSSVSDKKRNLKAILQMLTIVFFVFALARPQFGESEQKIKSEGVEIIFAVDVSESMMAEDVRPSRLAQVKAELNRLVDLMPGNRIGVLAFAGSAALLSPLTNDPGAVKMYVDSLETSSVSTQGTHFSEALRIAKEAFERGGVTADEIVKVTRVILIASDGEDHEPGAIEEAKKMSQQGTRIFTMAYGTERGGPIPVRDSMGFLKGNKKDRQGQTVITTVKGNALRELAQAGNGSFYFATFGGDQINQIVEDISKLEKAQFDTTVATQYDERFQTLLLLGVLLGLIDLFLGERRDRFRFWKGRFQVPPS